MLILAAPLVAKEHDFTLYPPSVPAAHIVEADPPQTNTFCAANLSCSVTGAWSFSNPCTIGGFIYVSTGGCYTTVSAAIASFSGGLCGTVYIPSGSFNGNITINNATCTPTGQSGITLQGAGRRSTILKPSANAAVITIDSTAAALQSVNIRDIGFDNTGSGFAQPAILFQGANINDHHELHRLYMTGFKNSINVTGRMVWQTFDDIEIAGDTDIAMNILTAAATDNLIRLKNIAVISAAGAWGIQVSCTGACGGSSIFAKVTLEGGDIEACTGGGIVFNNVDSPSVLNSYFESNGGPHISVTGTVGRGIFIAGNFLHSNLAQNLMSFTATQLAGIVVGNSLAPAGGGQSYVQTTSGSGNGLFFIGNFDTGTHTISPDANGTYHTSVYGAYAPVTVTASGSQTPSVAGVNHLHYQNTVAATITNFLNGDPGQTLDVTNEGSSTVAFTHASSSGPFMINGQSVTLGGGQSCRFIFEPLNSRWMETSCTNGSFATLTGTETLSSKTLTAPTLTGVTNGTGLQLFNTTTTCTTGAAVGAICTTAAITLPVAYADTNYRLACTGQGPTNVPIVQTYTKSNTTFTITIAALTAAAATFTSYDCSAVHN